MPTKLMGREKYQRKDYVVGLLLFLVLAASVVYFVPKLDPNVITAIIAGAVSVFLLILSNRRQRQKEIEQDHRRRKEPIYEEFVSRLMDFFLSYRTGATPAPSGSLVDYLIEFTQKVIVWGSDEFVKRIC
jgi:hypothetical protein